jgi:hypothetical protein
MKGKALKGIISFILIMSAIGIAWWINYSFNNETEHVQNPTLADSIRKGKERAQIAKGSARIADSVYISSEGGLKVTRNDIQNNTAGIAHKRDGLRAVLKARAHADSINRR